MTEIREVNFSSVADIPGMMERMAADIRSGEHQFRFGVAVFLDEDGAPTVCGWGADADDVSAIGALQIGINWLAANKVRR